MDLEETSQKERESFSCSHVGKTVLKGRGFFSWDLLKDGGFSKGARNSKLGN